jgi:hypothetical protein
MGHPSAIGTSACRPILFLCCRDDSDSWRARPMLSAMPKRPSSRTPRQTLFEWRVVRLKKSPAALIGYVTAPDQEQAIKKAIEAFGISDPVRQSRLSAYKVREVRP